MIDRLYDQAMSEDIAVACLYCDYLAHQEQTTTNMMGAVLKQLLGMTDISKDLRRTFQEGKKVAGGRRLLLPDLVRRLKIAIASLHQVFICIDALDEFLPKHLPALLESLGEIIRECPRTRIFLTGRPHVKENIQRYFTKAVVIPIKPNTDDIRNYLETRLDMDHEPEAMDNSLRADIMNIIPEKMSDMCVGTFTISCIIDVYLLMIICRFLLVSLNIDSILEGATIGQRRKKLREMARGNGLSDAYTATLSRLKAQKGNKSVLGLNVLMWVLYSGRPLRAKELCHALGVEIGSVDLDSENVPEFKTLLSSCLGLVTVEESSSTVRLVHFTLKEHLSSDPTLFHCPHSTIAEVCLTYLNFGFVRDHSPNVDEAPSAIPFLDYASCYWAEHASEEMTEIVKVLALRLLDKFDEHISSTLLLLRYIEHSRRQGLDYLDYGGGSNAFTGLHGAAFLGIVEIFAAVLKMKEWDVNARDALGGTALTWATERGHERAVKMLLERRNINPDQADNGWGWTPLICAAEYGHEGIAKLLLEREGVNPNATCPLGDTALSYAAVSGHVGVVKMLLEREDVDPNQRLFCSDQTLLKWAAEKGHEEILRILLEREDVDPNEEDEEAGGTLLTWAARNGNEGVVKMLLEQGDVSPGLADADGWTPLFLAAQEGHEGVVKILLEQGDVSPGLADTDGWTPLLLAAQEGHEGVVKILLGRKDVNPNHADTEYGQTPLTWASEIGHEGVVKILLEREDVNPDHVDTQYGGTPLSWAADSGHEGVVKLLLERSNVNPNLPDTRYGRTPLSRASENGHDRVVKMLLEREDVNPNVTDTWYGRTPLAFATSHGHENVVKILLERDDVNPNTADAWYGRMPLALAAENGHEGVVKILLERNDILTATPDNQNQTPLSLALSNGHHGVVRILRDALH